MTDSNKPFLVVYVVWHYNFEEGLSIAKTVRAHFRRRIFENVSGSMGVSVVYRSTPSSDSAVPLSINLNESQTTAIVVLISSSFTSDYVWTEYVQDLAEQTEKSGLSTRIFPVSIESEAIRELNLAEQALRWDRWTGTFEERRQRLNGTLTYEFCLLLRHYLDHLEHPAGEQTTLKRYLEKVQVFLSHSKHDDSGVRIALAIRDRIHARYALSSFFDVYDIPAGLRFHKVLLQQVQSSALIAIHTDSYSSRGWCRREVIEAKLSNIPLVVANCVSRMDERSFPYMGNVPNIRLDGEREERIDFLIECLLDEILKDFLWQCRIKLHHSVPGSNVVFLPRPPELISLACHVAKVEENDMVIVYPDPPLSKEEKRLFTKVAPHVRLLSIIEWTTEK